MGKKVSYKQGKVALEGYLAYDDAVTGKRPAVLVVHDWMGISAETRRRVDMLAALGYVALAADVYGKGVRPTTPCADALLVTAYTRGGGIDSFFALIQFLRFEGAVRRHASPHRAAATGTG